MKTEGQKEARDIAHSFLKNVLLRNHMLSIVSIALDDDSIRR